MMKKIFTIFLALTMAVGLLAGCGKKNAVEKGESDSNKLSVVTTIFPEYDWVKEILGDKADNAEVTMLLDNGVDLHSYQPTADDIVKISDCDLFIYVGGESDGWVDDALKNATNKNMKVINLLDVLGDSVKTEEVVEGMQETEHDHDHDHSKEVSTFEDDEVQDRSLSDWAGDWQSAYPFVLDGTLDDAFAAMAEKGEMTAEEYKTYYQNGYKTDISNINIEGDHIEPATSPVISAQCLRVACSDGHMAAASVKFKNKPSKEVMIERWNNFKGRAQELNLPSAPEHYLTYFEEDNRPQTKLDRNLENGMGVSIGRLREDTIFDYKFVSLSHNTLRGAAGGAVLMAELLCAEGYMDR